MAIFCKQYQKAEEGSTRCLHFSQPGLCSQPGRLRCIQWLSNHQEDTSIEELCSHPEFGEIPRDILVKGRTGKEPIAIKQGEAQSFAADLLKNLPGRYSFSQLFGTWAFCRRKWYWEYVKRVKLIRQPHYFVVGSAGHAILEAYLSGTDLAAAILKADDFAGIETGDDYYAYRLAGVKAVASVWCEAHKGLKGETEVKYNHPLLPIIGYVDFREATSDGKFVLWEHKFASGLEMKRKYRTQACMYFSMEPSSDLCVINVMKKPSMTSMRPKKGETVPDYQERVRISVSKNPDDYLATHPIRREACNLDSFRNQLTQMVDEIETARQKNWHPDYCYESTSGCETMGMECDYKPLCEACRLDVNKYRIDYEPTNRSDKDADE